MQFSTDYKERKVILWNINSVTEGFQSGFVRREKMGMRNKTAL